MLLCVHPEGEIVLLNVDKKTLRNILLVALSCIFFYWLLHETDRVRAVFNVVGGIVMPFIAGATIAFILNVPTRAFEGLLKGIKQAAVRRLLAVVMTFIALALVLALVFWLLIPEVMETIKSLIPTLEKFVIGLYNDAKAFVESHPNVKQWITQNASFEKIDWSSLIQKGLEMIGDSLNVVIAGVIAAVSGIAGVVVDAVIAIVFAIYCLFQKETLSRQGKKILYAFCKESTADYIVRILRLTSATFTNFLSGQCIEVCILGAMFAITMAIFKMPYIPLISVLIAVTAFIPIVGAWIGCAVGAFLILVAAPHQVLLFVIMFVVLQQIENNLIYPKVVGTSIGLSGMWVLIAVAVGGELFGVVGMFLMIPMASVIQTVLREITAEHINRKDIDPAKLEPVPPENRVKAIKKKAKKVKVEVASEEKKED